MAQWHSALVTRRWTPRAAAVGVHKLAFVAQAAMDQLDEVVALFDQELCVTLGLRDGLRSGDVFVPGSRRPVDLPVHDPAVGTQAGRPPAARP